MKQILLVSMLTLLIAGCNLTSDANSSLATDTPPPTRTLPFATDTTPEASVPNITITPATTSSDNTPTTGILCVEQSDWHEYTVQPGDNLTKIAARTRSTVDELIEANCLDNPNRLRVGDTIYVPNEPQ